MSDHELERHPLEIPSAAVGALSRSQREDRVRALLARSAEIVDDALAAHLGERELVARVVLFSGGNDSTTLLHLARHHLGPVTHTAHANTGVGIEQTREFVRATSAGYGIPLLEVAATPDLADAADTYRALVLRDGFPGGPLHYKVFQRLKERALDRARRPLGVHRSRKRRALFIAGRRREESFRRQDVPLFEPDGSVIWSSPLAEWTKLDLNTYRLMHARTDDPVPVNEVSDLLHMSGECLCGCYAKPDELENIGDWYPEVRVYLEALEAEIADRPDIPAHRKRWGWSAYKDRAAGAPERRPSRPRSRAGRLCSSCQDPHLERAA